MRKFEDLFLFFWEDPKSGCDGLITLYDHTHEALKPMYVEVKGHIDKLLPAVKSICAQKGWTYEVNQFRFVRTIKKGGKR